LRNFLESSRSDLYWSASEFDSEDAELICKTLRNILGAERLFFASEFSEKEAVFGSKPSFLGRKTGKNRGLPLPISQQVKIATS
jgi:hypothetical protein